MCNCCEEFVCEFEADGVFVVAEEVIREIPRSRSSSHIVDTSCGESISRESFVVDDGAA